MAEAAEDPGGDAPSPSSAAGDAGLAAVALSLAKKRRGAKADDRLDAYLDKQGRLIDLQMEHLHEQRELQLSRLRWARFSDRMKAALQLMTASVGLAVIAVVAAMAWSAHEDNGLVIDAFSVPPDLARDGLTGEVVAVRFMDRLQAMQTATFSDRPASSYENNWGSRIKLEIPETGLTFGELETLLRDRLGHASHVTGEVTKTPAGITLTARLGEAPPQTFEGQEAGIDAIAQQAAEAIYRSSQPYRFSQYLEQHGRIPEAFAVIAELAANGPPSERGWAYAEWSSLDAVDHGDTVAARRHGLQALAEGGASTVQSEINLITAEVWSGHDEKAFGYSTDLAVRAQTRVPEQSQAFFDANRLIAAAWLESLVGDERRSAVTFTAVEKQSGYPTIQALSPALAASGYALDHDLPSARAAIAPKATADDTPFLQEDAINAFMAAPVYWIAVETGDWSAALADARAADAWIEANKPAHPLVGLMQPVWIRPLEALALGMTGDAAGAEAVIGTTPHDCYLCLRVRGRIAAQTRDWRAADRWFVQAARQAPSLPFAYTDWSEALLARGDVDGAIARLTLAHAKSPHFADPMELWGEALMAKGDSEGAVAKFAAADKDAPRWGRNHLRWGQALARLGQADQARAQWRAAAAMDLSPADQATLQGLLKAG